MRTRPLVLLLLLLMLSGTACARKLAKVPPLPELMPPPPPPREVEIYVDGPVPTIEPGPAETALNTVPTPKPPARPPAPRPEPPKPEPPRIEPERPAPAAPALTLKPAQGVEAKTEASIRNLLFQANRDLNSVKYAELDADGIAQFNAARRFMAQAEEWLKGGNLVLAGKLADKAATMASVLMR